MHGNLLRFLLAAGVSAVVAAHPQSSGAAVFNVATPEELFTALSTAAGNGEDDVVNLAAGTYAGSQFQYYAGPGEPYSLSLIGAGAAETVFDAAGGDGLLYLYTHATDDSGIEIHVEGRTFRGVATSSWAALFVWTGFATLEIEGCAFIGNTSANYAGGLAVATTGGDVTVSASRFESNSGWTRGGGFFARNTDAASHVRLVENTFEGNSSSGSGGGAHIEGWGSAAIEGNRFLGNTSAGEGGGWYVYGQSTLSTGVFTGNVVSGNTAAGNGGGDRISVFGTTLAGNIVAGNRSTTNRGGGAWVDTLAAPATFTANTFTGNQAANIGGGLFVMNLRPGCVDLAGPFSYL